MRSLETEDLIVMFIALAGGIWLLASFDHGPLWQIVMASVTLSAVAAICGHFLNRRWAYLFAGLTFAFMVVHFSFSLWFNGTSLVRITSIVLCIYYAWIWLNKGISRLRESDDDDESAMVSIVALAKELPFLDSDVLKRHVSNAWGIELGGEDDEAESFVVGEAPMFIIKCDFGMFMVHYHDRTYFDDPEEAANSTRDMRLIHVLKEHSAWFSVDCMVGDGEAAELPEQYAFIGKLLSEIVDDECLGLLLPYQERLFPWEPKFAAALVSDNPLETLCPELLPVVQVADDDPRMQAAVQEARDRFPEFEQAFESRGDSELPFSIKAPVTGGGNTEFIWISVTAIENKIIYGNLGNDPVNLGGLQEGDAVRVNISDLNDWMYMKDDDYEGGFTVKILSEIYQQPTDTDETGS